MPRSPLLWAIVFAAAGCAFDAGYAGGHYTCSDGVCPAGQTCSAAHVCVTGGGSGDAGPIDAPRHDAPIDAPAHALTCSDPGEIAATGGTVTGTTAGRGNHVTALCGGVVQNALDAVYAIPLPAATQLRVSLAGSAALDAYVIAPCAAAPATPACVGNAVATVANPLLVTTPAATTYYVVVDSEAAAASGPYTLTITRP